MQSVALVFHVALCIGVIALVLLQHGKGADAGAAFGSGASGTVFGARGATSFMTRMTTLLVSLFFVTSMTLFYLAAHRDRGSSSVTDLPGAAIEESSDVPNESEATTESLPAADTEDLPAVDLPAADTPSDDLPPADPAPADTPADDTSATDLPAPAEANPSAERAVQPEADTAADPEAALPATDPAGETQE